MTTGSDHGNEPADLSELSATDALLDRLGARNASVDDLGDPAASALADLLAAVDRSREPDVEAARLIEVLAGRPLYIAGAEPATDEADLTAAGLVLGLGLRPGSEFDEPVPLDGDGSAGPGRVIDLTEREHEPARAGSSDGGTGPGVSSVPAARLPAPTVLPLRIKIPEPVDGRRWDRVLSHASLPAASVLLLLAVGGGVSAAVTGDPMAPVDGISRVVAQLPGVSDDSLDRVKSEISAAQQAVWKRDSTAAEKHLNAARAGLADVPDSDKTHLNNLINEVAVMVATDPATTAPGRPGVSVPPGVPTDPETAPTTQPIPAKPPVTAEPTVPVTEPPVTADPTKDPDPTDPPVTAEPVPTTDAPAAESTPAPSASAP